MPISPEYLPNELHYIIPLAELHGSDAPIAEFDDDLGRHVAYGETLKEDDLAPLRELYLAIKAKDHSTLINTWHQSHNCNGTCPSETTWPVNGLLVLFEQLANLDIAPFNDRAVGPESTPKEVVLDWNKLPPELRYLAGPAEVYGALQFDDPIYEFLQKRMTADERSELQALAVRAARDREAIKRWLDEFSMTKHEEASLVYFTGYLLSVGSDLGVL